MFLTLFALLALFIHFVYFETKRGRHGHVETCLIDCQIILINELIHILDT